ncbi:MAG: BatA and WFA domain-containing protein [Gemmatimonadaceae bacterium]|nr:BatA and WFA domain-containing protein [Gemmatimonadaceae bacterium]
MQLSFLAPLFAAALAAIGIPILVHLVHKERKDAIAFPSLMFLQRTPYQHASRQRIRDWLLFAARCLVIALLAAAFMRPVFARTTQAAATTRGETEVVVLLDRSLSMRYGNRWRLAQEAVRARIASLGRGDQLTLVPFDVRAGAVNDASSDASVLRAALDTIQPVDAGTRLAPAVGVARRLLGVSRLPRKELVVVSDFQRSAWDLGDDVAMPPATTIVPVDVSTDRVVDRSVRSIEMRRDPAAPGERVIVAARIVNVGGAVKGVAAQLEVAGRVVERRQLDLAADGGGTVAFSPVAVPADGAPARIVIAPDALTADDALHFVLRRSASLGVLLLTHPEASSDRAVFAARALAIGDQPAFDVRAMTASRATAADLEGRRLLVLNDAGWPAGIGAPRLLAFVRGGGGMFNALGERSSPRGWPTAAASLLPGEIGAPVDRLGERGAVLGYVDRSHPALSVFGGSRSGDLSAARFFRYRPILATDGVLARFDDGAAALVEHRLGRGRLLTWGSSLDGLWNDLPRQAVFLPFLQQLAQYTASYRPQRASFAVGESVDLREGMTGDSMALATMRFSVIAPDGARLGVGGAGEPAVLELRRAGWYEVRRSGAPNDRARTVAANPPPSELEFASFDPARLTNALAPAGEVADAAAPADPIEQLRAQERTQSIWWYLLVVTALVLLAEGILASRVSRRRLQPR